MAEYIQKITTQEAEKIVVSNFLKFKAEKAQGLHPMREMPRLLVVGTYGIYDIVVRATMQLVPDYKEIKFVEAWDFDGGYNCGGSCNRRGGFTSVQDVIDFGIMAAKERYAEFDERDALKTSPTPNSTQNPAQ